MVSSFGFQPKNESSILSGMTNAHIANVTISMSIEYDNLERQISRIVSRAGTMLPCHGRGHGFESRTIRNWSYEPTGVGT